MFDFSFANILHSNIINFAIMIAFFAFLAYKLEIMTKIEDMRASVQKKVEESDQLKKDAEADLQKVSESLGNVEEEINAIIEKAEETAKSFEQKTREELDKSVEQLKQNAEKQLASEKNHVQSEVIKSFSNSSIEIAQKQIKSALENDKQLHRKYIEDFINSIDKIDV